MKKRIVLAMVAALSLAALGAGNAIAHGSGGGGGGGGNPGAGPGGPGMMMSPDSAMGPGMMGPALMRGPGFLHMRSALADRDLTPDDVRNMLERNLAWHRNTRLKVGDVIEEDDDTIVAEIVTMDDSLVQRLMFDRHTGFVRQAN